MKRYIEILRKTVSVIVVTFLFVQFFTVSPLISEENSSDTNIAENQTTETVDNNENNTNNTNPSSGDVNNENNNEVTPGDNTDPSNPTEAGDVTDPNDNIDPNRNNEQGDVTGNTENTDNITPDDNNDVTDENNETEDSDYVEFRQTIDDIEIIVTAYKDIFPEDAVLSVEEIEYWDAKKVTLAVKDAREENQNVVRSFSYDIKILDSDGKELQPNEGNKVNVSFKAFEVENSNLDTNVYHIKSNDYNLTFAEALNVETDGDIATVETEGFSYYTVEFTYSNKQYILEGNSYVRLLDILEYVGLSGEVTSYSVSNTELFNIFLGDEDGISYFYETVEDEYNETNPIPINNENGTVLYMVSLQSFLSDEWLKVTIDGIEYTIVVTDAIRVDENGDQVSTSVRYISSTSTASSISTGTNSAITDSRVIQGPTEDNFTASMPLAEIYIDDTIVNQTLWRNDDLNGTRVIAELLVDNTQGQYKGFKINSNPDIKAGNNMSSSYGAIYYDFSERYLNDTQTLTVSGSSANNYERFSGDIIRYTLKGMATKFDPVANEYKKYDVVITYSDLLITLAQNSGTGSVDQANINDKLMLIDTNMVNFKWNGGFRAGLEYNVNVKVVDPDTGALVDGSYYYPMTDIDVGRTGIGGFANLYNAANVSRYSEQVALLSNYGRPTSTGSWEQKVWIPGGNWSQAPVTNLSNITDEAFPYTCKISNKTINGQQYLTIEPSRANGGMTGAIAGARGISPDNHDNSFYSGFITLANNTAGGINIKGWASAPTSGGVESYVLTGSQIVNHKVDASSDVGGTIFTTTTGNADGSLSGGTLLGYNEINKPFEISAATGQSVTYTMTPKGGYKLKNVWVKDGDIDIMTIVNTAKATVNENDYDANSDGELDENERQAYEAAVETAINTALASDSDTSAISISSLTSLGKGVYAYTFTGIQEDKSIHIDWEKTDLTVTKELDPVMQDIHDKFKFRIELSDTTTEETTWRVRAKKNTGTLNYNDSIENGKPYYMTYYESRTEEVPYKYVVVSDTTDKNPYEEGWYYYQNGTYYPTYDTTPASGITYYVKDDTQTSTITNYYHHILGWSDVSQTWDDRIVSAPNSVTTNINLGTDNLDKELSDNYRFVTDGTHVYITDSYDEIEEEYTEYLIWVYDDTISEEVLVIGNLEMYPDGRSFIADNNYPSRYTYIFNDGIENYSRKIIHYRSDQVIDDVTYCWSSGHYKYEFVEDTSSPVYYNLQNNPDSYTLDSGYTAVEGESGLYIVTLPAGQNPDTIDLLNNGWEVTISRVGAIEDNFDLEQAMIAAGATPVLGTVNTFEFELGVGETIDFNGVVPMGYDYVITEVLPPTSRWELLRTSGNDTVSDFDGEEHVTFTNTERRYDITIEKDTVDDEAGSFDFTIEIYREHIDSGQVYEVSIQAYKNSQDVAPTYKLSNSGSPLDISINNVTATIPTGDYIFGSGNGNLDSLINYLIDMDNSTNHSMYIGNQEAEASTGVHTSLSSQVQEYIDGGYTSFSLEPVGYEFSTMDIVTKIPYIPDTLPSGFSGSNGVYTFNLTNGGSKVFTSIPFGYKYEITETLPQGWENESKVNEKGTLTSDTTSTWVNKLGEYDLTVNKETVNNDAGQFNFRIKAWRKSSKLKLLSSGININDYSADGVSFDFYLRFPENGIYTFTTYSPSRLGCDVAFSDSSINEYTYDSDGAIHKLSQVDTEGVYKTVWEVYNSFGSGDYSFTMQNSDAVSTSITNDDFRVEIDEDIEYFDFSTIAIPVTDDDHDGKADDGIYAFTLSNHGSITALNIPYGYTYEVYEVDSRGHIISVGSNIDSTDWKLKSITGDSNTGTITDDTYVNFTNELVHDLTITKQTTDNVSGLFDFKIVFTEPNNDSEETTTDKISVKKSFIDGSDNPVVINSTITWAYDSDLYFILVEDGVEVEQSSVFTGTETGGWSRDSVTNEWTYSFNHEVDNLKTYSVKEPFYCEFTNGEGGDVTSQNTVTDENNFVSYAVNRDTNSASIVNVVSGYSGNSEIALPNFNMDDLLSLFTNKVYADEVNVPTLTPVIDEDNDGISDNGEYTFKLANGQSITIPDIAHGTSYEVYEQTQDGWRLIDIDGSDPTVNKGAGGTSGTLTEDKEHIFENEPLLNLKVTKKVAGNMGNKNNEFNFTIKIWKDVDQIQSKAYHATDEELVGEAYAYFDSSDGSLVLFRDEIGKYSNNQIEGTKTYYTGIETISPQGSMQVPWYRNTPGDFKKIIIQDSIKPKSTAFWFENFNRLESVEGLNKLDTSEVTSMQYMFRSAKIFNLDLSTFDVSKVRNMSYMFFQNTVIRTLNLDGWDLSKCDNISFMFFSCIHMHTTLVMNHMPAIYDHMFGSNITTANHDCNIILKYISPVTSDDIDRLVSTQSGQVKAFNGGKAGQENLDLSSYEKLTDNNDGTYSFKLKHNEEIIFEKIPYGYKYEIIEDDYLSDGYKTTIDGKEGISITGVLNEDKSHIFTNINNAVVPTKVSLGIFGPIFILNVTMIVMYYIYFRKKEYEDME